MNLGEKRIRVVHVSVMRWPLLAFGLPLKKTIDQQREWLHECVYL